MENYNNPSQETWKDIADYDGRYQISNLGNVKTFYPHSNGAISKVKSKSGYHYVKLLTNGKGKHHRVHRLVAFAFIPNPLNLPFVNHINGIKTDNRVENLEWCTNDYNLEHAERVLGRVRGQKKKKILQVDLYGNIVREIFGFLAVKDFGFNKSCVEKCCSGKAKSHHGFLFRYG